MFRAAAFASAGRSYEDGSRVLPLSLQWSFISFSLKLVFLLQSCMKYRLMHFFSSWSTKSLDHINTGIVLSPWKSVCWMVAGLVKNTSQLLTEFMLVQAWTQPCCSLPVLKLQLPVQHLISNAYLIKQLLFFSLSWYFTLKITFFFSKRPLNKERCWWSKYSVCSC